MNLSSLKRELEQLKALARARRPWGCVCRYVEIVDGRPFTTEQKGSLNYNRQCYERTGDRTAHVGFTSIVVPACVLLSSGND